MLNLTIILIFAAISYVEMVKIRKHPNLKYQVSIHSLYPWVDHPEDFFCSGTIIQYNWIMSNLRCIEELLKGDGSKLQISAGFDEFKKDHKINRTTEKYVSFIKNQEISDIAFVKVKKFERMNEIQVAKLPKQGEQICEEPTTVNIYPKLISENITGNLNLEELYFGWYKNGFKVTLAIRTAETIKVGKIQMWSRKKPNSDQNLIETDILFTGVVPKRPNRVCTGHRGWPLFCEDKLFGIEIDCTPSHLNNFEDIVNYAGVDSSLDFLAKARSMDMTEDIRKNGKMSFHEKSNWIEMFVIFLIFFNLL